MANGPLRVGIGGPVGAGKTTLTEKLAHALAPRCSMAVITNDIYTREDAEALMRAQVLPMERIRGVETGGCPHTAIREDASINLAAVADLTARIPDLDLILIESGGDNLAATFSPELADLTIYVIDTAAGQDIPRKRGPGLTKSDLLVVNKIDLAPHVGVDLTQLEADTKAARGARPYVMGRMREGAGIEAIIAFLEREGGLVLHMPCAVNDAPGVTLRGRLICRSEAEAEIVRRFLPDHITQSRAEPGCLEFRVFQQDDPLVWLVEEHFRDQAAFMTHQTRTAASDWGRATAHLSREYRQITG